MTDIFSYAAGTKQGADGMTGRERQAKNIMALAQKFSADMHANEMAGIAESQKAAQADIIQNTIDPARRANDEAYAGAVLRNELHNTAKTLHAELDNPASEHANMNPEDYKKFLQDQSKDFYSGLKDSPHAKTQARIFTNYTFKNQAGLIAKQAKIYKDGMKKKQATAAMTALTDLPPGEGDAFDLNTHVLISEMLPADRFTSEERLGQVMGAAIAAAHMGDRRLLDFAKEKMDAETFAPVKIQQAENAFTKKKREDEAAAWQSAYAEREAMADNGEYSYDMMMQDLSDPEIVRNFTSSAIRRWGKAGHQKHMDQLNYTDATKAFFRGDPIVNVTDSVKQQVFKDAKRTIMEKAGNDKLGGITDYAFFLAKQGSVDKETKQEFKARFGRPVWTKEAFTDPNFLDAVVVYDSIKKVLTNDQLVAQVGEKEMSNAELVSQFIDDASAKYPQDEAMEKAAESYIMHMTTLKNQPELKLDKPDDRDVDEAVAEILDGSVDGADPAASRWFAPDAEKGIHTSQLAYEIRKQYGIERARGISDAAAMELAKKKVAAGAQYFGNEMVWTEGVSMNTMLNMPDGATAKNRDAAWEQFCEKQGVDSSKARFAMYGQYGMITDEEGNPIEELGMFPLFAIGQDYQQAEMDRESAKEARDLNDKLNDIGNNNRKFEAVLDVMSMGNDKAAFLKDGTTIENYKASDEDSRLMMRNQYRDEKKGFLGNLLGAGVKFIQDIKAGKYKGEAEERFKSVASDATLMELSAEPVGLSDTAVEGMREVDKRAQDVKRQNDRLLRSRDGEIKLTAEERRVLEARGNETEQDDVETFKQESQIKEHEGFRGAPYKDSVGVKTVGYGRNLEANPITKAEWKAIGGKRDLTKEPLTEDEADVLFQNDMKRARSSAKAVAGKTFNKLTQARKDVLIDMAFNLGGTKLKAFKKFLAALRAGDYDKAAEEMRDSKWAKQVGRRADKLIATMKKG